MNKVFKYLLSIIFVSVTVSCSEEELFDEFGNSKVEILDTHKLSIFRLPHKLSITEIESDVDIIQVGGNYVMTLHANISGLNEIESITEIEIPNNINIPDGNYIIKFDSISNRFIAKINTEKIAITEINNGNYQELASNGTKTSPFKINSNDDFNKFIKALSEDSYNGAGFYFKQTSSIVWSNDESNTGEGLSSQTFAGVYDGDNKILGSVTINGKNETGLFATLTNGATIKNINLNNISYSNGNTIGAIAGKSEYTVKLSNIKTSGEISGTENIGGLIGIATGNLYLENITINTSVTGTKNIGGVVGYINNNCHVSINTLNISDSYRVGSENPSNANNATNAGGIIGLVENSSFEINNANIIHSTSFSDNAVILAGDSNIGGFIGQINSLNNSSSIANSRIISPFMTNSYGGGFIGKATINNKLSISNCQSCIISKQGDYIGGIIGYLEATGDDLVSYTNNDIVASDGSDIYIGGNNYIGGLFGILKGGSISLSGENYIMTSIKGNSYVGGLAGSIENTTFNIGTPLYGKTGTEITGLQIEANTYVGGAAGYMNKSTLKSSQSLSPTSGINQFNDDNAMIICTIKGNGDKIGGAVGQADESAIEGISVKATITNETGGIYTGGIVGYFNNSNLAVNSCSFSGIINGGNYTGGIVGEINNLGQIKQCINYGTISGGEKIGGIVGKLNYKIDEPIVNNCANVGNITGKQLVGGIIGYMSVDDGDIKESSWVKVEYCGNYGNITGSNISSDPKGGLGGIVGKCDSRQVRVAHCANHGTISGTGDFKGIGGIAGALGRDAGTTALNNVDVYNCANFGLITTSGNGATRLGGILGYIGQGDSGKNDNNSEINDCYNIGEISSNQGETYRAGILGYADHQSSVRRCINYGQTHDGYSIIGTRNTAAVVHDEDLYYLSGTGAGSGGHWDATSFSESEMDKSNTFSGLKFEGESDANWKIGNINGKNRAILIDCPFQHIAY